MRIVIETLDPGEELPERCSSPRPKEEECWDWGNDGWWNIYPTHVWSPVNLSEEGSVWFCSRCKRIERRSLQP